MKKWIFCYLLVFAVLIFTGCDTADNGGNEPDPNPVPTLSSISPTERVSHLPTFILTVTGTNFINNSTIVFNGQEVVTTFVSATELTGQIEPGHSVSSETNIMGSNNPPDTDVNVPVLVRNPAPGGGDSNPINFDIISNFSFAIAQNLSNDQSHIFADYPDISVDHEERIYVVWVDENLDIANRSNIKFTRSLDGGSTWSSPKKLLKTMDTKMYPSIAVSPEGYIYVVWDDFGATGGGTLFTKSTDRGATWSTPKDLAMNGTAYEPEIAVSSAGRIAVVWRSQVGVVRQVTFTQSTDEGSTWSTPVIVSAKKTGMCMVPRVFFDPDDNLLLSWYYMPEGTPEAHRDVYFQRSTDNGTTWSIPKNVSNSTKKSYKPIVQSDSVGELNCIWYEGSTPNHYLFFKRSDDDGSSWTSAKRISAGNGYHQESDMAIDTANNINVVWAYHTNTVPTQSNIFFSRSINDGIVWTTQLDISNPGSRAAGEPAMVVDSNGSVYVVWEDRKDGPFDIFFTRSTN